MRRKSWLVGVLVFVALGAACEGDWPASMAQQPSVGPLAGPRAAPVGSVAVGVDVVADRDDVWDARNPMAADPQSAERGAAVFAIHCVACHGREGRGDGLVSRVMLPAPDLRQASSCDRTDGFIYGTITAGGFGMASMREGLTGRDRWDLVSFVRRLQEAGCVESRLGMEPAAEPQGNGVVADAGSPDAGSSDAGSPDAGAVISDEASTDEPGSGPSDRGGPGMDDSLAGDLGGAQ